VPFFKLMERLTITFHKLFVALYHLAFSLQINKKVCTRIGIYSIGGFFYLFFCFLFFFVLAQLINNHQLSFCLAVEMGLIYARNIVS